MEMKTKNLQKVIFLESRVRKGRDENRGGKIKKLKRPNVHIIGAIEKKRNDFKENFQN